MSSVAEGSANRVGCRGTSVPEQERLEPRHCGGSTTDLAFHVPAGRPWSGTPVSSTNSVNGSFAEGFRGTLTVGYSESHASVSVSLNVMMVCLHASFAVVSTAYFQVEEKVPWPGKLTTYETVGFGAFCRSWATSFGGFASSFQRSERVDARWTVMTFVRAAAARRPFGAVRRPAQRSSWRETRICTSRRPGCLRRSSFVRAFFSAFRARRDPCPFGA